MVKEIRVWYCWRTEIIMEMGESSYKFGESLSSLFNSGTIPSMTDLLAWLNEKESKEEEERGEYKEIKLHDGFAIGLILL